jgi:hypothetical protein
MILNIKVIGKKANRTEKELKLIIMELVKKYFTKTDKKFKINNNKKKLKKFKFEIDNYHN